MTGLVRNISLSRDNTVHLCNAFRTQFVQELRCEAAAACLGPDMWNFNLSMEVYDDERRMTMFGFILGFAAAFNK